MHFRRRQFAPVIAIASAFALVVAHRPDLCAGEVRIEAGIQLVAFAEGPSSITLEPGESREVAIKVATNFPWRLSINSSNHAISTDPVEPDGRPGGFTTQGNTVTVQFRCSPDASGTQSGGIGYSINRR